MMRTRSCSQIIDAIDNNPLCSTEEGFFLAIESGVIHPTKGRNRPVRFASEKGYLQSVKYLCHFRGADPTDMNCEAVKLACVNGHSEIVHFLLSIDSVKKKFDVISVLNEVITNKHVDVIDEIVSEYGKILNAVYLFEIAITSKSYRSLDRLSYIYPEICVDKIRNAIQSQPNKVH